MRVSLSRNVVKVGTMAGVDHYRVGRVYRFCGVPMPKRCALWLFAKALNI